ncbi:MAG: type IV pilus twitching motility protein PilT [Kiritimatiellia bacterium]|jgi:twitching motility protein PilT|nr:type IV pilus twitching motility protein PilT [Kiritimatiellia bacterium]MDP6811130.1 type IV pilus twitching motility protein PilT [Kiritimatiellia bacterium]MDP7024409.1 type IV pilus twitching motility protein PilT [Kiritimatiellia bacterium]
MPEIDNLCKVLVEEGGSDLHLSAGRPPILRCDGDIKRTDLPVLTDTDIQRILTEIMPERNRTEFRESNDSDFAYEIPNFVRLRVNARRDRYGMGGTLRVIPSSVITADQLDLPKGIRDLCYLSKGLVVVTGPTGSGKSTTLAALIDLINATRTDHIITIEDPIEFVHQDQKCLITQREVFTHTNSFSGALRAALRQDPDIVLVGEMRDMETVEIAIETAETGHLVFGTLHTNTAINTVSRIIDTFPANRQSQIRSMLASSLKAAVCQTLCRRRGGGRVAAMEILLVDSGIASLIRDGKTHQIESAMQVGAGKGMMLMNEALTKLVQAELVEPDEAYIKSIDKGDLVNRLRRLDLPLPSAVSGTGE